MTYHYHYNVYSPYIHTYIHTVPILSIDHSEYNGDEGDNITISITRRGHIQTDITIRYELRTLDNTPGRRERENYINCRKRERGREREREREREGRREGGREREREGEREGEREREREGIISIIFLCTLVN